MTSNRRPASAVAALLWLGVVPLVAQDSVSSPRVQAVINEVSAGHPERADSFWAALRIRGGPLVEPHPTDPSLRLVTFVWRAREPVTELVISGSALGADRVRNRFRRVDGTDLWYLTRELPATLRTIYRFVVNPPPTGAGTRAQARRDSTNPREFIYPRDPDDSASVEYRVSLLELPEAAPQPWVPARPGIRRGTVTPNRFTSAILGNTRRVWTYTPAGYDAIRDSLPLVVVFDGAAYLGMVPTPTVLDNLIAERRIPPVVAILIDNPDAATRNRELDCYPPFAEFMAREMIPWIRGRFRVSGDPRRAVLAGSSGGGQASMCVAQRHPELFGNVLAQSGSFFATPDQPIGDEWVYRNLITGPLLPLRFYLDVGRFEPNFSVTGVRVMRDILEARRYPLVYQEYSGGHDYAWWRNTLADGLIALLGAP